MKRIDWLKVAISIAHGFASGIVMVAFTNHDRQAIAVGIIAQSVTLGVAMSRSNRKAP